jgi:DNA polymerase elongation subunit (family B)
MTDAGIVFQCLDFVARDEYILDTEVEAQSLSTASSGNTWKPKQKWYPANRPSPDDEKKGFQILLFGATDKGKSICVEVKGYRPFFYIQIPDEWTALQRHHLETFLLEAVYDTPEARQHVKMVEERHKKLFDFDNNELHRFLRVEVPSIGMWRRLKDLVLTGTTEPRSIELPRNSKKYYKLKVYEANIDPVLRFFHERDLEPAGWMKLPPFRYDETESDEATTALRYTIESKDIVADRTRLTLAPLLHAVWDIECTSSHGDFPQPKKTWRKVARELLEQEIKTAEDAAAAIAEAINAGSEGRSSNSPLAAVYLKNKKPWTPEAVMAEFAEPMELEDFLDNSDKKFDERISELDDYLTDRVRLGKVKGDEIIQIGIVLYRNNKPEAKHIFVLGTCDRDKVAPPSAATVPIHVYPFDMESKLLSAFHAWLGKTDPDVMITYNGFGFDERYIWERAEELGCTPTCMAWSRLNSGKPKLVEKFLSSAAMGDNTMHFINSPGRLKVDLLPYIRRNYNLDSYSLDNVAATFMSGSITGKVEPLPNGQLRVPTKSTKGAVAGRFIVLMDDDNDHVLDKAEIVGVEAKAIIISVSDATTKLAEHGLPPVRWAQVKDDVSPKELFALQRGSSADRAKIARYCLQDCDLTMEIFMKLEVLNNAVAMANVCSVPVSFIFMRGQGVKIESLVFKECRLEDRLIEVLPAPKNGFGREPPAPVINADGEEEGYEGAFVLDPVTGIYFDDDPVGVPDFSSLYPSTIISENLCHSSVVWVKDYKPNGTVVLQEGSDKYDNLPGIGYVDIEYDVLINDPEDKRKHPTKISDGKRVARFAQPPNNQKSTIPNILAKLLSARKASRKQAEKETDEFRKALLDAQQLAYKLTANSLYGQLGSGTSKIRRIVLAASTTAYGRKQLIFAKECIESIYGGGKDPRCDAMAVYGDTDSLFIRWRPKDVKTGKRLAGLPAVTAARDLTIEAGQLVSSCLKAPHDFEFDKAFKTFCLLSKKRYVGDMTEGGLDTDDFHRKAMGIVMKRRDNAPIVKYVYGGVIENILTKQDITAAFNFAQQACKELVIGKFPITKLTITKSLRAEYKTPTPPAHKVLAERIGVRDPGNKPSTSERIPFVYIPAPPNSTHQGDRIETPTYIKEHGLSPDYAFYITNQIAKPVAQVFGLVVEKLPGVTKAELDAANKAKKPVDARERLAEKLLFGKILDDIDKFRKVAVIQQRQTVAAEARSKFIKQFTSV